jgi:CheY-like chemotaxis protein
VNLADVIVGMEPMLRRLIGEDVELVVECDPTLHPVRIDTSRLEQTIMNLAVNARDAMPQGGTLRITTASTGFPDDELPKGLSPDNVAVLTVSDTGHGMDEATQAQIFEPFFTTKPLGEGTGLGLAMVYGFVKQSGGAISVTSAPGAGATFRIVLPQQQDGVTAGVGDRGAVEPGSETILLTEDEATVRTLVRRLLHTAGYRVLTAASPEAALQICRTYDGSIDLLLTDVVMPQMSGTMLAREARQLRPSMSVLFMSGYSGPALSAHGVDATVDLIHKPFTTAALSERVRAALTVMGADRN